MADVVGSSTTIGGIEQDGAGVGGGVTAHGDLTGLGGDDHAQYILASGTRAFSGKVSGVDPTADAHLATKKYVDDSIPAATTPGGADTQVQFNDGGSFGGIASVTWDGTSLLFANGTEANPIIAAASNTDSGIRFVASDPVASQHAPEIVWNGGAGNKGRWGFTASGAVAYLYCNLQGNSATDQWRIQRAGSNSEFVEFFFQGAAGLGITSDTKVHLNSITEVICTMNRSGASSNLDPIWRCTQPSAAEYKFQVNSGEFDVDFSILSENGVEVFLADGAGDGEITVKADVLAGTHNTYDLGSATAKFANIYGVNVVAGDLHLEHPENGARWRVEEMPDHLLIHNKNTNETYRLLMEKVA